MHEQICYLCGRAGANSKDHVPAKCFLPKGNFASTNRITLMAHKDCNAAYSKDEEYVRDLIGPPAIDYPDGSYINETTMRAWQRPAGFRRLRSILKSAVPLEVLTPSGLFVKKAIGIMPDYGRVRRVGLKIAQGILFHDLSTFTSSDHIECIPLSVSTMLKERERELAKGNPLWMSLSEESCLHNMFSDSIAVRRAYLGIENQPTIKCICSMVILLYSEAFFILAHVSLTSKSRRNISILIPTEELIRSLPANSAA